FINMEKDKKNDQLLDLIRKELNAILAEEESGVPERKTSFESIIKANPISNLVPKKGGSQQSNVAIKVEKRPLTSSSSTSTFNKAHAFRQAAGGKTINMKPSSTSNSSGQKKEQTSSSDLKTTGSSNWDTLDSERLLRAEFVDSQTSKSIDEELQKMQVELKQSYELFQGIGEKFESINFNGLRKRIRDLHLNNMSNDMGKVTTLELQKIFETRYMQNRLDKLTTDVRDGLRRHPGEFGDIPELSTFFQACTQLEHGLDTLKQQRKRSSDLEKRLCWATEIAYDRMDEIRNAVGSKPESNF
ncbi:uncharacterized protein LOC115621887, partial [Scaptodrosophila lebanonensis]|uniref:Uncharacterized protein LOC115621887 n=1 Tax=Drosophila lebanonensis TaxID=7225 RepID=A0A6J2T8F8_DROLE